MANRLRTTPSTKARCIGYGKLHGLKLFLFRILEYKYPSLLNMRDHWLDQAFTREGWKAYMDKCLPKDKRGGVEQPPPGKAIRRKRRKNVSKE